MYFDQHQYQAGKYKSRHNSLLNTLKRKTPRKFAWQKITSIYHAIYSIYRGYLQQIAKTSNQF